MVGLTVFSLCPPKFNLSKMGRKWERKRGRCVLDIFFCLDKISSCLHSMFTLVWFLFFIFYLFFLWIKFCTIHVGSFCLFLSIFYFIFLLYFIYPFSICLFYKKIKVSINFFLIINVLLFVYIFNKDIMVNLYQLYFTSSHFLSQSNKKVFNPYTFPSLQPNTN